MKILFAGPSIYGLKVNLHSIELRPPAAQGDIALAVLDGANAIGLIDGNFESIAAVWHKEILYALSKGVVVLGASSMGALRSAECAQFGMVPIGEIAKEYSDGIRLSDADVAVQHGPVELGFPPVTQAMVNVQATVERMREASCISKHHAHQLLDSAQRLFFKNRTIDNMFDSSDIPDSLKTLYQQHTVNQKQIDALELIQVLIELDSDARPPAHSFRFEESPFWTKALSSIEKNRNITEATDK